MASIVGQFRLVVVVLSLEEEWYAYLLAVGGIPVVHLLALGVVRLRERA